MDFKLPWRATCKLQTRLYFCLDLLFYLAEPPFVANASLTSLIIIHYSSGLCNSTLFACGDRCVTEEAQCDGFDDCLNNADEIHCG